MLWMQQGKHCTYPPVFEQGHFLFKEVKYKMKHKEQEWIIQVESKEKSFQCKGTIKHWGSGLRRSWACGRSSTVVLETGMEEPELRLGGRKAHHKDLKDIKNVDFIMSDWRVLNQYVMLSYYTVIKAWNLN